MEQKIQLTPNKILNKEFNIDFKGYNATEVDYFLDTVLSDYESFSKIIELANSQIEELVNENKKLKDEMNKLHQELDLSSGEISSLKEQVSPQVDILRRLSLLEKAVFETKNND